MSKSGITRRILSRIGPLLASFIAIGAAIGQQATSVATPPPQPQGKRIFEMRCATCHGLDGLGGEHAPDIIRQPAVNAMSDQALLKLIHDGIPQSGMPAFSDMAKEDSNAVVTYMRRLQGKSQGSSQEDLQARSAPNSMAADPTRGRDLFSGKAGCSTCHQIAARSQFLAGDLTQFAKDHEAAEIREAILRPAGNQMDSATVVTRDGRKFSGTIRNEDNASLQLQDEDGRLYLLMKSSLKSVQRKTGEPMPVDFAQRLNSTEIDDLVAYIRREAGAPDIPSSPSEKHRGKDQEPHVQD